MFLIFWCFNLLQVENRCKIYLFVKFLKLLTWQLYFIFICSGSCVCFYPLYIFMFVSLLGFVGFSLEFKYILLHIIFIRSFILYSIAYIFNYSVNKFLTLYFIIALHVYFFTPYLSQIFYKIVTNYILYLRNTSIFLSCCTIARKY